LKTELFVEALIDGGFGPFMGVPCSIFKDLINCIYDLEDVDYYLSSSEGEAMGLAAGFALSEHLPVVLMQNDGYGNAVNPLSSLQLLYKFPCLMLISWRGEPGTRDAPQHSIMGETIERLLSDFAIPYVALKDEKGELKKGIAKARDFMGSSSTPYAFLLKNNFFNNYNSKTMQGTSNLDKRIGYLKVLNKQKKKNDLFIGTTGFTGREMCQVMDCDSKFYMMGSMGCASSIGLAIARENRRKRIFILDGDGAILMKMGTLSTIGYYGPENLIHICFDNNQYESTGGQKTSSVTVDFQKIADACGYGNSCSIKSVKEFQKIINAISQRKGPHFIHINISPGTVNDISRPDESPGEMKASFMSNLK
tara:strand:- start:453 stop:1547 length:1095 start_codon:yes stop_codon:yes gene_type:complete